MTLINEYIWVIKYQTVCLLLITIFRGLNDFTASRGGYKLSNI